MKINLTEELDSIVDCCNNEISALLLESYIYGYIKKYITREKKDGDIAVLLGNLSYVYSKNDITELRVKNYINKLTSIIPYFDKFLCEHISNFMEMILLHKPKLIEHYLIRLNQNINVDSNNNSILYSAVVIASLRNKMDLEKILSQCKYNWHSYFKMSSYYLYNNDRAEALSCIIKAAKNCPKELKEMYKKKEKYIISHIAKVIQ